MEQATLAGGCFWCIEAIFKELKGVQSIVSGYSGGHVDKPTYAQVCGGKTGHAEAVQITFNPKIVSYRQLLEVFYYIHNPTTLNRQGNDVGEQYRSAIFYHDDQQKDTAKNVSQNFAPTLWDEPVVTELVKFTHFWPAEEEHQDFYTNNSAQPYCQLVINPKLEKFRAKFQSLLK